MEFEYRVLVDNVMAEPGWTSNLTRILSRMVELRDVNPHAIITIEISPWEWKPDPKNEGHWIAYCPGCEYASCPLGSK